MALRIFSSSPVAGNVETDDELPQAFRWDTPAERRARLIATVNSSQKQLSERERHGEWGRCKQAQVGIAENEQRVGWAGNGLNPRRSHFSWEASDHQLLIVDIQGVGDFYTDPQARRDRALYGFESLAGETRRSSLARRVPERRCAQ